jgi:hypothetical protein
MYLVVSKWEALPGKESEVQERARQVRKTLRSQPGCVMVESIYNGKNALAVHGYVDEDAYKRIVQDDNGPFARAVAEHRLEEVARWVSSEAGNTVIDD